MSELASGHPEVLSGFDSLDRPVRWVHVTEIDDVGNTLEGNEVVLTTGLPLSGHADANRRFLAQLAAANACGLVVELSPGMPELPAEVIAEAVRLDLPLVALHRPVRFISITEAVHRLIVGEQYQGLEFAQRTHEVFTTLSLDSADASSILREASELVDGPVVLEDLAHRVVAFSLHGHPSTALLESWHERSRRTPPLDGPGVSGPEHWLTCPVGLRGSPWGRLVAPVRTDDERTSLVLQRAAQALQISRLVERDARVLHFQAQESLFQEVLDGRVREESDAVRRARALGVPGGVRYLPVVVEFPNTHQSDEIGRQQRARALLDITARALDEAQVPGLTGGIADDCIGLILVFDGHHAEDATLRRLATAIVDQARSLSGGRAPVLGVGRAAAGLVIAISHIRSTAHIARAAKALPPSPLPYFRSSDVRLRGLVAQLQDDERLLAFAESELAPLLALKPTQRAATLALVRAFVELRGNKMAMARALGTSRPSLYTRLRLIEEMLHIDLDDPDSLLSLGVALLAHDMSTAAD